MRPAGAARLCMSGLPGMWVGIEAYNSEPLPGRNPMSAGPSEIVRNNVKEKLARGEVVSSITVRLVRSIEIARIAKTAGFDSIYVDAEHSSLSLETTSQICIAALETEDAIDGVDEISAVAGVNMVLMGANDLLADMALPGQYEHERVREAYSRTIAACKRHGKHVGVGGLATRPKLAAEFVKMGARYVSTGTDLAFLLAESTARAKQVQEIALR